MDRANERRLLQQAARGDADAFAELYRDNVQAIYRYIANRVNDQQLAEDLTGDVFTKALQGLSSYQDRGKPFLAWLYRIARARVIDHYRRTGRRPVENHLDTGLLPVVDTNMDEELLRKQALQALEAAIIQLTDEQQQVIILRFIERQSLKTVALIMGKDPSAIKALQYRALRALAKRLKTAGFDIESILAGIS